MGMFTRLSHEGKIYQFKTGWDDLLTYEVGDTIDWQPDPHCPGEHIDGAHDAIPDGDDDHTHNKWVVIRDCVIVAVEPRSADYDYDQMVLKYNIQPPERSLWTTEQWAAKERREAKAEADYQKYLREHPNGTPIGYYMHCKLNEPSFMDQIFPSTPVRPPGPNLNDDVFPAELGSDNSEDA